MQAGGQTAGQTLHSLGMRFGSCTPELSAQPRPLVMIYGSSTPTLTPVQQGSAR